MDNVQTKAYMMQTNGLLLDQLDSKYLKKFNTLLVSLDGDEILTDYQRGEGTYKRVINNLKFIRSQGFQGELIARMTVTPKTNIRQAVNWLLFNNDFPFESVHWQLDAQFWQSDYNRDSIRHWFEEYNKNIVDLVEDWISYMKVTRKVLRVYPFIALIESFLTGEPAKLRCGAGWNSFNVQTDGKITPCPVLAGIKPFIIGDIWETDPKMLYGSFSFNEPCTSCSIFELCGGRCLYAKATKLWGTEGFFLVCRTVKNLVNSLKTKVPIISQMLSSGWLSINEFNYPKYNSCEIIP